MKNDEYLYGKDVIVEPIPQMVIDSRVRDLKSHINYLVKDGMINVDMIRLNKVIEAISFWKNINKKH